MSRPFGWGYPPGVSSVPGDEDELCAWCGSAIAEPDDTRLDYCSEACVRSAGRWTDEHRAPTVGGARMMFAAMDEARASRPRCACGCQDASWRDDPHLDGMRRYECDNCFNERRNP